MKGIVVNREVVVAKSPLLNFVRSFAKNPEGEEVEKIVANKFVK